MNLKKIYLIILIFATLIVAISAVSAADVEGDVISSSKSNIDLSKVDSKTLDQSSQPGTSNVINTKVEAPQVACKYKKSNYFKVKVEEITNSNKNKKYYYCFAKVVVDNSRKGTRNAPAAYYRVRLFYSLELPIVNSLVFTIDGKTDIVEIPSRCEIKKLRASGVKCTAGNVKNT